MNSDSLQSIATKLVIAIATSVATKYHLDGSLVPAISADVVDLAALAYGVYSHWNMVKVPAAPK